jgi:hypothetical protein
MGDLASEVGVEASANVPQQPPFRRGVFGGIASELKSRNPRILGVFSSTSNPSRGASFPRSIPVRSLTFYTGDMVDTLAL